MEHAKLNDAQGSVELVDQPVTKCREACGHGGANIKCFA